MAAAATFRIAIICRVYDENGRECVGQRTMAFDQIHFINVVPRSTREKYPVLLPRFFVIDRANRHAGYVKSFETGVGQVGLSQIILFGINSFLSEVHQYKYSSTGDTPYNSVHQHLSSGQPFCALEFLSRFTFESQAYYKHCRI